MINKLFRFPQWLMNHPSAWFLLVAAIIPVAFICDRHLSAYYQIVPALLLWYLLIGALSVRPKHDRLLLGIFVVVATLFEMLASLVLHWYTYRLHNIPLWVPPGHGIVFLSALVYTELPFAKRREHTMKILATIGVICYGIFGLVGGMQPDYTGALFGALLLVWMWALSSHKARFYTALWVVVCYLEICGVHFGAWQWAHTMPLTGWSEASPPSGIVGAYGGFDLIAFGIAALAVTKLPKPVLPKLLPRTQQLWLRKSD